MNIPDIILLEPNRVWRTYLGGKTLDTLAGKDNPQDTNFPEDWIASTTVAINKGRENIVNEGLTMIHLDNEDQTLKELISSYPDEIVGAEHFKKYGANTRFLLKFLDSSIRLHIQCHPTVEFAKKYLNSDSGKTEAYVILKIRDEIKEPYIYLGFQNPPDKNKFKQAILNQNVPEILSCFEKVPIKPGDVFMVPGGLPHAIGEGVFMIEIMEPTDFAVRIEFERGGIVLPEASRFMGRDVDFALSLFNFEKLPVQEIKRRLFMEPGLIKKYGQAGSETSLIDENATRCFRVNRLSVQGTLDKNEDGFYVGIVIKGEGSVSSSQMKKQIKFGDKFFVPAKTGSLGFDSPGGMEIIITKPPL